MPNPRHDAVYKGVLNLRTSSPKRYVKENLFCMFPERQSREVPMRPPYGRPSMLSFLKGRK
jgi:hypothetical protein